MLKRFAHKQASNTRENRRLGVLDGFDNFFYDFDRLNVAF
jgi:hypothetical protein